MGTGEPWQRQNRGAVIGYVAVDALKAPETSTTPLSGCGDPAVKRQLDVRCVFQSNYCSSFHIVFFVVVVVVLCWKYFYCLFKHPR